MQADTTKGMFRNKKESESYTLDMNGVPVEVTRKRIKTIRLRVNQITREVRVSCPFVVSEKELMEFLLSKESWIQKHRSKALMNPISVSEDKFIAGDKVPFAGSFYQLELKTRAKKMKVEIIGEKIVLHSKAPLGKARKKQLLDDFYRHHLKQEIPKLIEKWEPVMHVSVAEFGVKNMKTRWGTCNIRARRIWLSLELAKKTPELLEYVVVHEMVHLLERLHNQRFKNFMTEFLPNWKELQGQLNGRID